MLPSGLVEKRTGRLHVTSDADLEQTRETPVSARDHAEDAEIARELREGVSETVAQLSRHNRWMQDELLTPAELLEVARRDPGSGAGR